MPQSKQDLQKNKNWKHSVANVLRGVGSLMAIMPHRRAYGYLHETERAALCRDMMLIAGDMTRSLERMGRLSEKSKGKKEKNTHISYRKGSVKKDGVRKSG